MLINNTLKSLPTILFVSNLMNIMTIMVPVIKCMSVTKAISMTIPKCVSKTKCQDQTEVDQICLFFETITKNGQV